MNNSTQREVILPTGHTGSSLFHAVLAEAVTTFPVALGGARFPARASAFKRQYGAALARFEAARVSSAERVEIARFIVDRTQGALAFGTAQASLPLAEHLGRGATIPALEHVRLSGSAGLRLELPFAGKLHRDRAVLAVVDRLFAAHQLTSQARDGLHWIVEHALGQGGQIDLTGQRFVVFGAAAELASTRMLLQAGAHVLWIDVTPPEQALSGLRGLAGTITHAPCAGNLLEQPAEIAAAIRAFAADHSVHVGMFAYAPGASKEWRLAATMNAIVASLEPGLVRSVSLLISPTTPSVLSAETLCATAHQYERSGPVQRTLRRLGVFEYPGALKVKDTYVSLSTVSLQGLSYQAAQYISKILAAETYAVFGSHKSGLPERAITVSANVAGVTRTRSMAHPLFEAAFEGAEKFGVRIFEPATTRALSGLLMLHDLLNPAAPGARQLNVDPGAKATRLLAQQIHGGIYSLPFALEGVIRAAALLGLFSQPSLLVKKRALPASLPPIEAYSAAE